MSYEETFLAEVLPFQLVDDNEFANLMYKSNPILKFLNKTNSNEVDWPIVQNCNYRSVEWYSSRHSKKHSSSLDIVHFNVRSLTKNKNKIEELLQELTKEPDIIAISESKLNDKNIEQAELKNYHLENCNSLSNAGGVAIYVNNFLRFSKIEKFTIATVHSETLFVEIKLKNRKKGLVIGVVYRHPSSSLLPFQNQFTQTLNELAKHKKEYIIFGDFNVDLLKHQNNSYVDSVYAEGCFCLIDKPTRITSHSATLLDHVYSNILEKTLSTDILLFDISDHLPTTCSLNLKPDRTNNNRMCRNTTNFCNDNFINDTSKLILKVTNDLYSVKENETTQLDKICTLFINEFSDVVNTHAPLKPLSKRKCKQRKKPWMTKEILELIKTKNSLFAKCYKQNKTQLISSYKQTCNKLTTMKRKAKEQYYTSQLAKHKQNTAKQWKIINELLEKHRKQQPVINKLVDEDNKVIKSASAICNTLNEYFVNIGPNLSDKIVSSNLHTMQNSLPSNVKSIYLQPIDPLEVFREINNLNPNKAGGPENIPIKFYKIANESIAVFLCDLFNICIENGHFPTPFKLAKVIPIFKAGKHCAPNNYRPISLLSPVSKIFERLIHRRLMRFLEDNNTIADEQLGFRKLHCTTHVVADVITQISTNLDNKLHTCMVLLDLRKAFDTVNHKLLLQKLEKYGIRGKVLKLFHSYLANRSQFVCANSLESKKLEVKCGVPQGSILGPTLFSLYVNDLPNITNFTVRLFADDTVLIMSSREVSKLNDVANKEIKKIENWLSSNKLTLNLSKTNYMLFSHKKDIGTNFNLKMHNKSLQRTSEAKYLGIYVDEKLKWDLHVKHVCKKISQYCGLFCKLRYSVNQTTLVLLYYSLVFPHLLYGILGWGSSNSSILHPLQVLQNKIIRIICFTKRNEHVTNNSLFQKLNILKLKDIYYLEMAKFMYQFEKGELPNLFQSYFVSAKAIHKYNTRNANNKNYYIHSINSNTAKKSLPFSGAQIWNSLKLEWKDLSYHKFKRTVKSNLVSSYI